MNNLEEYKDNILEVKKHLYNKCADWVASEPIRYACQHKNFDVKSFYITGGCFEPIFRESLNSGFVPSPEIPSVKDYDLFFMKDESMEIVYDLYEYYEEWVQELNSYKNDASGQGIKDADGNNVKEKCLTDNAITLCDPNKLQLICRYDSVFENPVDNINAFDFQHLLWYYHYGDNKLYISENTFNCILNKDLVLNPNAHFFDTERYERFMNKGWHPSAEAERKYLTEKNQNGTNKAA